MCSCTLCSPWWRKEGEFHLTHRYLFCQYCTFLYYTIVFLCLPIFVKIKYKIFYYFIKKLIHGLGIPRMSSASPWSLWTPLCLFFWFILLWLLLHKIDKKHDNFIGILTALFLSSFFFRSQYIGGKFKVSFRDGSPLVFLTSTWYAVQRSFW